MHLRNKWRCDDDDDDLIWFDVVAQTPTSHSSQVVPAMIHVVVPATGRRSSAIQSASRCCPAFACVRSPATWYFSWRQPLQSVVAGLDETSMCSRAVRAAAVDTCRSSERESAEIPPEEWLSSAAAGDTSKPTDDHAQFTLKITSGADSMGHGGGHPPLSNSSRRHCK